MRAFLLVLFALSAFGQDGGGITQYPVAGATKGAAGSIQTSDGAGGFGTALPLQGLASIGPRCAAVGDSITARNDYQSATQNLHNDSYFSYGSYASGAVYWPSNNAAVGGTTTAQILASLPAVLAASPAPNCLILGGGTNDTNPITQTLPNLKAAIKLALAAGITPVLVTVPPQGSAALAAPSVTLTPQTTGGTLAAGSYCYRVSTVNGVGQTTASAEQCATTTGTTGSVLVSWTPVQGVVSYKIYGRTTGAELLMATNAGYGTVYNPLVNYTDTGATTPSGALPASNTTAIAYDSTSQAKITGVNAVLTSLAGQYNLPIADFYSYLVDSTSGLYKTGYTVDGVHPTPKASKNMGVILASALTYRLSGWKPYIAQSNTDASLIYTNPLFTSNNGTNPTGWGPYNGTAAESITTSPSVLGSVYQMQRTDATSRFNGGPTLSATAGDVIAFSGYWNVTGADSTGGVASIGIKGSPSNLAICGFQAGSDTPVGLNNTGWVPFYCEATIPAGDTAVYPYAQVQSGPVTLQMAQFTIRDLTVLGVRPISQ